MLDIVASKFEDIQDSFCQSEVPDGTFNAAKVFQGRHFHCHRPDRITHCLGTPRPSMTLVPQIEQGEFMSLQVMGGNLNHLLV